MNEMEIESGDDDLLEGEVLPSEADEEAERQEAERIEQVLASFGETISKLRDEAVAGRAASGIEQEWLEDEEYYEGIDDANRDEMPRKSVSMTGSVRLSGGETKKSDNSNRSTIFLNITRPYVDAGSARVSDMLLPTDDRNWAIRPTPLPELIESLKNDKMATDGQGNQIMRPLKDGEERDDVVDAGGVGVVPATVKDVVQEILDKATQSAEKAERRIDDWLQECQYHAEVRLVIESSARIGAGILKGPMPKKFRRKAMTRTLQGAGLVIKEQINPASKFIEVWNFYPDPSCGDDIQSGKYVFERDEMTGRKLSDLKGMPGYIDSAIDACLEEGPLSRVSKTTAKQDGRKIGQDDRFEVWYFYGYIDSEDMQAAGCECEEGKQFPAIVTMVNNRVIKAALQPLDSGEFPYDIMVWQRRVGHWAGIGISRQMRTCQRGVNAAARNLMDNAGRSARPYVVRREDLVEQGDDQWTFIANSEVDDVSKYMTFFVMPSLQAELINILQLFMKFAEDVTGLPMLIQGQQGKAPDTVGGMQMLNNNATSVLRRIARIFDDRITERHIARYYEWLLMYGPDESEKGDFTIDARGSSALIERDIQNQAMMGMLQASLNPAFGLDPEKVMQEALKAQRLDPKRLELDEDKKKRLADMQSQQPQAPQILAAQIREEGANARQERELSARAAEADKDRQLDQWLANLDASIENAKLSADQRNVFDGLRTSLTRDVLKLRTQKELAGAGPAPQVATPATEPPGRAAPGMAFPQ